MIRTTKNILEISYKRVDKEVFPDNIDLLKSCP